MSPAPTIPILDQVAADCLRGMLADQYWKPDLARDGAEQAYMLAGELLRELGFMSYFDEKKSPYNTGTNCYELRLTFARAALAGMLANPHIRLENTRQWAARANEWADAMLAARVAA